MCLQFGFLIFWQKDFGTKAAHKMLVKLTPDSNLRNISKSFFFNMMFLKYDTLIKQAGQLAGASSETIHHNHRRHW
jgi:hypothetical protein